MINMVGRYICLLNMCPSTVDKSTGPTISLHSTSLISNSNPIPISNDAISLFSSTDSSSPCNSKRTATSPFIRRSSVGRSDDYYTKKRIEDLHERMDDLQMNSFLKFLNHHLQFKYKTIEMKNLSKDLSNGHIWIDLLEILSSTKFRRENGRTRFHALTNVQYVLEYLKSRMQHINITPHDIVSGNQKQILALLWIIMKTFDFPGFRLTNNRQIFSEKTLLGCGQDRSTTLTWLNHLLNTSCSTKKLYVDDFYLQTWISTCYFIIILKYLLPVSRTYLTEKSFDYLKHLENPSISNENRFQYCLELSHYSFSTINQIDLTDKTERTLFRYFTEFQLNIFKCVKADHVGKLCETNPYMKQLVDSIVPSAGKQKDSSNIHPRQEYLIPIQDESPIAHGPQSLSSTSPFSNEESSRLRTVEKSRSFTEEQQRQSIAKRRDRWNSITNDQEQTKSAITNDQSKNVQSIEVKTESSVTNIEQMSIIEGMNQNESVLDHDRSSLSFVHDEDSSIAVVNGENEDVHIILHQESLVALDNEQPANEITSDSIDIDSSLRMFEPITILDLSDDSGFNSKDFRLPLPSSETSNDNTDTDDLDRNSSDAMLEPLPIIRPTEATIDEAEHALETSSISSFSSSLEEDKEQSSENLFLSMKNMNGEFPSENLIQSETVDLSNQTSEENISTAESFVSDEPASSSFNTFERDHFDPTCDEESQPSITKIEELVMHTSHSLSPVLKQNNLSYMAESSSVENDLPETDILVSTPINLNTLSTIIVTKHELESSITNATHLISTEFKRSNELVDLDPSDDTNLKSDDDSLVKSTTCTQQTGDQASQPCAMLFERSENVLSPPSAQSASMSPTQPNGSHRSNHLSARSTIETIKRSNPMKERTTSSFIADHSQPFNSIPSTNQSDILSSKPSYSTVLKKSPSPTLPIRTMPMPQQEKLPQAILTQKIALVQSTPVKSKSDSITRNKRTRANNKNPAKPSVVTTPPPPPSTVDDEMESMNETPDNDEAEEIISTESKNKTNSTQMKSSTKSIPHRRRNNNKKRKKTNVPERTVEPISDNDKQSTAVTDRNLVVSIKEYWRDSRMVALIYVFILFCFCFALIILVFHQ